MKKVLTVGVYDLLHIGHVELFRKAKALGDYLIVAVQDSDVVLKFKPEAKMVYSTEERCYMVRAIRYGTGREGLPQCGVPHLGTGFLPRFARGWACSFQVCSIPSPFLSI